MDSKSGFAGTVAAFVPVLLVGIGLWAYFGSGVRWKIPDRSVHEASLRSLSVPAGDIGRANGLAGARDNASSGAPAVRKPSIEGAPPSNDMPWEDPRAPVSPPSRGALREAVERGGKLYASACAWCHGMDGRGEGPWASRSATSVRDLTIPEKFVARSSVQGTVPFEADIYRTLRRGLPGTAMPSYRNLSSDDLWALVAFIKTLSSDYDDPVKAPKEAYVPAGAPEERDMQLLLANGRALYLELDCARCHGEDGAGDAAAGLADSRGKPFATADFVSGGGRFLCGMSPRDVARTILIGMPGTPMEPYVENLYGVGGDPRGMPAESRAAGDRKVLALVAYTLKLVEEAKRR